MSKTLIITHSATYHADEVFGCALIKVFYSLDSDVIRTLEPELELERQLCAGHSYTEVFVIDIGRKLGNSEYRGIPVHWMDHHQDSSLVCAASLIYRFLINKFKDTPAERVLGLVSAAWLQGVDQHDRGLDTTPRGTMTLSRLLAIRQPRIKEHLELGFFKELAFAEDLLANLRVTALEQMENDIEINNAIKVASLTGFTVTDNYMRALIELLAERETDDILYTVYPHNRGGWALQAVSQLNKMTPRRALQDDLCIGAHFVHVAKFLAVFATKEQAIAAATQHINQGTGQQSTTKIAPYSRFYLDINAAINSGYSIYKETTSGLQYTPTVCVTSCIAFQDTTGNKVGEILPDAIIQVSGNSFTVSGTTYRVNPSKLRTFEF